MKSAKGARKKKTADKGLSSFTDALVVPQLARACTRILSNYNDASAGSGLKKLRLVSQRVRDVLQRGIQGYTLVLGAEAQASTAQVLDFFEGASLLSLSIVYPTSKPAADATPRIPASTEHVAQLSSFIAHMGPALGSIKRLNITLPSATPSPDASSITAADRACTASLLPLASACPCLEHLTISGRFAPSLLEAFGSRCPQLCSLHASLELFSVSTLKQLPALLPCLSSLGMLQTAAAIEARKQNCTHRADNATSNAAACIALRACPNLLSFDTTAIDMTADVWAAIPAGLLSCTTGARGVWSRIPTDPPQWQQHAGLHSLTLTAGSVALHELAIFLAAAPNLSFLLVASDTLGVPIRCRDGPLIAEQLCMVDARIQAGLLIATRDSPEGATRQSRLKLEFNVERGDLMAEFLSASEPLPSFTKMRFHSSTEHTPGDLTDFSYVFPSLQEVDFMNIDFEEGHVEALGACTALRSVEFSVCEGVTCAGLQEVCSASTSLRQLSCYGCKDIGIKHGKSMGRKGWGGAGVQVFVDRGDTLEEEDHKHRVRNYY